MKITKVSIINMINMKKIYKLFSKAIFQNKLIYCIEILIILNQKRKKKKKIYFQMKIYYKIIKDIITKGFNKYYFKNCRQDYILMRNICFAFICLRIKAKKYDIIDFNLIFSTFKGLLIKLNFEYIDRIKALIAITREFEYQKYDYTKLGLDIVKSTSKNKEFSYYTRAMSIFLNIINDLTENCAFYKGIRQFNGIILEDEFS